MKIAKLITVLTFFLPVTALAVINPPSPSNEICVLGKSCSYTISGRTNRIIDTPDILPLTLYTCSVIMGDGLAKLRVENVKATPSVHYNVMSPNLAQGSFLSFINIEPKKRGSIIYDLYNSDFYGLNHSVSYRCVGST